MGSPACERAIEDALSHGHALLKFISPNDVGLTGSHQRGYYLPKAVWTYFSPNPPEKGKNSEHFVTILWQDGHETHSRVIWYGKRTRSEYRLTRFGKDFPFLISDNVGNLLVLIRTGDATFYAYVLDSDADIEELKAALGVELIGSWALYNVMKPPEAETAEACIDRLFRTYSATLEDFPSTAWFSERARNALFECVDNIVHTKLDNQLMQFLHSEYALFRLVERRLCQSEINRLFQSIDDFLQTAGRIMNRRKSRAGRSLENHVEFILRSSGIPFDMRPLVDGRPDILIPGKREYEDPSYPRNLLFVIGVKTTCKDRWRQVLNEARGVFHKHILTIQHGISINQLNEMNRSNVSLIVPSPLHKEYPSTSDIEIMSLEDFVHLAESRLPRR